MTKLTHFDASGQAHMVDVANKQESHRQAIAVGSIYMSPEAFALLDPALNKKGDVLGIARIAAIQGAKQTAQLIPLCHPLSLTHIAVCFELKPQDNSVFMKVTVETVGRTGVEMEALTATTTGLLTVYDMLKAVDKGMRIENIHLQKKLGGKSGIWESTS